MAYLALAFCLFLRRQHRPVVLHRCPALAYLWYAGLDMGVAYPGFVNGPVVIVSTEEGLTRFRAICAKAAWLWGYSGRDFVQSDLAYGESCDFDWRNFGCRPSCWRGRAINAGGVVKLALPPARWNFPLPTFRSKVYAPWIPYLRCRIPEP